jgi:hypothetical protein
MFATCQTTANNSGSNGTQRKKLSKKTRFLNDYKRFSSAGPSAKRQNGIGEDVQDQLSYLDLGVSYFLKRKLATASKPSLETNTLRNEDALRRW